MVEVSHSLVDSPSKEVLVVAAAAAAAAPVGTAVSMAVVRDMAIIPQQMGLQWPNGTILMGDEIFIGLSSVNAHGTEGRLSLTVKACYLINTSPVHNNSIADRKGTL